MAMFDRDKMTAGLLRLFCAAGIVMLIAASAGCTSTPEMPFDWAERTTDVRGWSYIRLPHMERSIWFCTSGAECTWQRLGELTGLDPADYQWWAQDVDGKRVLEARPKLGKRYTVPNRVYLVMGDASFYNPFTYVPYLRLAYQWAIDYPESIWSYATRPIGRAWAFRSAAPLAQGYSVTKLGSMSAKDMARILKSPDTFALVYFGHGNKVGLSSKQAIHPGFLHIMSMRNAQHHLMGKAVLNSCVSQVMANQMASPTGTAEGHEGRHQPPIGTFYW
ncbi:MAG: hypothetical protein HQ592_18970 [Planctomycetes bacterium]|nr:hypothetical protein [Planctomycetota bacterium]